MDYKKLTIAISFLVGTILFGTVGYHLIEGMTIFDAFYMTVITISTVGFKELQPLTLMGRIITITIITTGIAVGTYALGMIVKIFIEGELIKFFGRRKLEKHVSQIKNHFIICGFGRIGQIICEELFSENIPFVVIEKDLSAIGLLEKNGYLYLNMDATDEESMVKAGINNARGLVTAVRDDADNVFITLTARGLRPDIFVLSRASNIKNESKLIRAGASRVVSPYLIGGRRMAQVLKRPTVVDFIDIAMMNSHLGLMMEEAIIGPDSNLVDKSLIDSGLRKDFGVIIVAIKKSSGQMIFNPMPSEKLESGDVIVVIGKKEDLIRMNEIT